MNEKEKKAAIKLGFGGLLKGVGDLVESVMNREGEDKTELNRTGEILFGGEKKGIYGISIKSALGGEPIIERFGNIRENGNGVSVEDVREPMVDVFEEEEHILVIAEMPGVEEKDIDIDVSEKTLKIKAKGEGRSYFKEISLPEFTDVNNMESGYQRGILKVKFGKIHK